MSEYGKEKLVWFNVYYPNNPSIHSEETVFLAPSLHRSHSRSVFKHVTKYQKGLIHTQVPFRMNRMFQFKAPPPRPLLSRSSEDTCSNPSVSSYGMFGYENAWSSASPNGALASSFNYTRIASPDVKENLNSVINSEFHDKPTALNLLEAYVNEVILKKKNANESNTNHELKVLFKPCIESSPMLKKLIKNDLTFLPAHLVNMIKGTSIQKPSNKHVEDKKDINNLFLRREIPEKVNFPIDNHKGGYISNNDVSAELLNDNSYFKKFYQPVLLTKTFVTKVDEELVEIRNADKLVDMVEKLTLQLLSSVDTPDSEPRRNMLTLLKSAKYNLLLLKELTMNVDSWLDILLQGLFSKYRSIVEDTCLIISFICFQPILSQTLINNCQYDVGRDIVSAILKAMELKPYWFWVYNYALGYVIGCCQQFSILEVIIEKVQISKQPIILHFWPHFIYYATKFWQTNALAVKRSTVLKVTQFLEYCIIKKLSYGPARRALVTYSKRCSVICRLMTTWPL